MYKNSQKSLSLRKWSLDTNNYSSLPTLQEYSEDKKYFHVNASGCFKGSCICYIITIFVEAANLKMIYLWNYQKVWPFMVSEKCSTMRNDYYSWLCHKKKLFNKYPVPESFG